MTQKPAFEGVPLIEIPKNIPTANFLKGDYGRYILERYNAIVKEKFNNNGKLKVLNYNKENDIIVGSNTYAVPIVNEIVEEDGLHTATQADLENILKLNALNLEGIYEDSGLALKSEGEPNSYLAKKIYQQIKAINKKTKLPIMTPLSSVRTVADSESPFGLAFELKEDTQIIYAPVLNKQGNFISQDINYEIGLPKKVGSTGNRTFYTADGGLRGLFLNWRLGIGSIEVDLEVSYSVGRVVVVGGGAATKNFEQMLNVEHQKKIAALNQKYKRALKVLEGKE